VKSVKHLTALERIAQDGLTLIDDQFALRRVGEKACRPMTEHNPFENAKLKNEYCIARLTEVALLRLCSSEPCAWPWKRANRPA
jgi:hypothetical protein